MRNIILIGLLSMAVVSCSTTSDTARLPKDPNITRLSCVGAGASYDIPPSETPTDKCCEGLGPAQFYTSQDGSTGYSHFKCIYTNKCTGEDQKTEYTNFVACCSGLVIMDGKCVSKGKCSADDGQILVSGPLNQKECIDFPACVISGPIDKSECEYCCPGSKYTIQKITGLPPEKCLGPNESLTSEETKYGWSEPKVISQSDFDSFKSTCIAYHHP